MGNGSSSETKPRGSSAAAPARPSVQAQSSFQRIANNYSNLRDLKQGTLDPLHISTDLMAFTKSNEWTGKRTFRGQCLHDVSSMRPNLYEEVMDIVGRTLCDFDDDNIIPVFGFGDQVTGDHSVFSFMPLQNSGQPTIPGYALQGVRPRYREIAPHVCMAGPTSFAPIILQAVNTVIANRYAYHILVIIADGQVTRSVDVPDGQFGKQELDTMNAICYASNFPLSIVLVGVGDGPWDTMAQFDDALPQRRFDNFQFVEFNQVTRETQFALHALMEIPDQYQAVRRLQLMQAPPRPLPPPFTPMVLPPPEVQRMPLPGALNYAPANYNPIHSTPMYYPGGGGAAIVQPHQPQFPAKKEIPVYAPPAIPVAAPVAEVVAEQIAGIWPLLMWDILGDGQLPPMHAQLCFICEDRKKDTVFQCGHETCATCSSALSDCPVCRVPIQTRIHRYGV
ncbi:hypothetical protein DYB38_006826 [Aphanomyces astaci]|uniref:RING-type domain-containing protein n=1 Tax=Aphanomyces astaci TaxID=112090 RepID=A0A397DLD4_APHAT|nr:hypothetical protein DYB38_006826 [Aphanomyces astaci]